MTDYTLLTQQLHAFCEAEPYFVPLLSNASALLWQALPDINWAGFYFLHEGALLLGPFQGKPACIRIPLGRGVCGTAAAEMRILRETITRHRWNKSRAAAELGLSRVGLRAKLDRYGIADPSGRVSEEEED